MIDEICLCGGHNRCMEGRFGERDKDRTGTGREVLYHIRQSGVITYPIV